MTKQKIQEIILADWFGDKMQLKINSNNNLFGGKVIKVLKFKYDENAPLFLLKETDKAYLFELPYFGLKWIPKKAVIEIKLLLQKPSIQKDNLFLNDYEISETEKVRKKRESYY